MLWARIIDNTIAEVVTVDPTTIFLPDIAAIFVPVPAEAVYRATLVDGVWVPPPPPDPPPPYVEPPPPAGTVEGVLAERTRRFELGFDFDFGDARGVHHIGTTKADMEGWDDVTKACSALIGQGSQTMTIVTDTGPAEITPLEWQQVIVAATAARQPIWAASFALQAMDPIPHDYTDDSYWVV